MISAAGTALLCLCLAQTLLAEPHNLRAYARNLHVNKELISLLASIEERLRVVDTISDVQTKQARRLEGIQEQLDRLETTVYLKIERTQLAAERLEHRLHILETNVKTSIKESSEQIGQSLEKIGNFSQNLTRDTKLDVNLVDQADVESPRRGHTSLEALMRDGLAVVNATRRELADGLRGVVRRQGAIRQDLEFILTRRLNDNNQRIETKIQEMLQTQRLLIDSCQPVQLDDPQKVTDVLDRLLDSLINITSATFREIQNIHITMRNNDIKVMSLLNSARTFQPHLLNAQSDTTCKRLEIAFRNASISTFKENELRQLTEKFISLTDRADAALQKFEVRLADESEEPEALEPDVAAEADKLLLKLHGIKDEPDSDENHILEENDQDNSYFGDDGGDIMDEDKKILSQTLEDIDNSRESKTIRLTHQRHLHKHPYDRGPKKSITSTP